MNIKDIKQHIIEKRDKLVIEYEPTEQHFKVGDIAYVCFTEEAEEVIITNISDFRKEKNDGGLVYYWYEYKDIPLTTRIIEEIKFQCSRLFRYRYDVPYFFGPGHSELLGKEEVLFKSKEQAELDANFYDILYRLDKIDEYCDNMKDLNEFLYEYHDLKEENDEN